MRERERGFAFNKAYYFMVGLEEQEDTVVDNFVFFKIILQWKSFEHEW